MNNTVDVIPTAERMKAEGKCGDVLLFSWGLIEQEMSAMLRQLGRSKTWMKETYFRDKLNLLVGENYLTENEREKVAYFKQKRDAVFHNYTMTMMWASDDRGKEELADIAISALKVTASAFNRSMKPIRQTSEARTYFLGFDSVEPNEFREE